MRLPRTAAPFSPALSPTVATVLTSAATAALTTGVTLGASHASSVIRLRLAERLAERAHRRDHVDVTTGQQIDLDDDEDTCHLDLGPYPDERIVLRDMDGASMGACIAALRERYLVEDGSATEILNHFDYHELLRSFAEVALLLAYDMADANFMGCGCDDEDCPNQDPDPETHPLAAGKYLLLAAQSFEARNAHHIEDCATCAAAGHRAPRLFRAQFCRDIADDLITNAESDDLILHGVPLQAAFDVVCTLLEILESMTEEPIADKVDLLSKDLAAATGHNLGVPFGGHTG